MAYVKVRFCKNAAKKLEYISEHRGERDVVDAVGCSAEMAEDNFRHTRELHHKNVTNEALHIVQSWSPEESALRTPEEFNSIGKKLAEEKFPGHQFVIRTHTDKGHTHNHIVLNTVNSDTGKRINNKKALIKEVRDVSDKICREHGLSVINADAIERRARMPFKVQQMVRFNRPSYLHDMTQKLELARRYATNFGEYTAMLTEMNIRTAVQNKNITYFYPGREKGKRGSKLGEQFDKEGLAKRFKDNEVAFASNPALRNDWRSKVPTIGDQGKKQRPSTDRGTKGISYASEEWAATCNAPVSELRRARRMSLVDYCRRNNIELARNARGDTALKGREHIVISDYGCRNTKNGTQGGIIDFVAIHRNSSFLQAVAHINNNPRLLLLEENLGEAKRSYTSFYIPKHERLDWDKCAESAKHLMKWLGADPRAAHTLHSNGQLQAKSGSGRFRLFGMGDSSGAWEFVPEAFGAWSKRSVGKTQGPFFASEGRGNESIVFLDPFTFLSRVGPLLPKLFREPTKRDVLVLMEPDEKAIHRHVAGNKDIKRLFFAVSDPKSLSKTELDLFNNLRTTYQKFGITLETISIHQAVEKSLERGHSLGLSR